MQAQQSLLTYKYDTSNQYAHLPKISEHEIQSFFYNYNETWSWFFFILDANKVGSSNTSSVWSFIERKKFVAS